MHFSRKLSLVVLLIFASALARAAVGQSVDPGDPDYASSSTDSFLLNCAEIALGRMAPLPETPYTPKLDMADRLDWIAEGIADEALYRAKEPLRQASSMLGPQNIVDNDFNLVKDTTQKPYRAICHVTTNWRRGDPTDGTGFMVSPRVVLTCRHNVWYWDKKANRENFAVTVMVTPGRGPELGGNQDPDEPFGKDSTAVYDFIRPPHKEDLLAEEFAWIILPDRRLYNRVKFFLKVDGVSDSTLKSSRLTLAGYMDGKAMTDDTEGEAVTRVEKPWFFHKLDSTQGSSGSPIYLTGDNRVVGIHASGFGSENKANGAFRITDAGIKQMQKIIREYQ